MITSIAIVPISGEPFQQSRVPRVELYPARRKALRIESSFGPKGYVFEAVIEGRPKEFYILLNGLERIHLSPSPHSPSVYVSRFMDRKDFLAGNLGLYQLLVVLDGETFEITNVINGLASKFAKSAIRMMYESVASSDFFTFYIGRNTRGNTESQEIQSSSLISDFWLQISILKEMKCEVDKYFSGELEFRSRVSMRSSIEKYRADSQIESDDICWLLENTQQLQLASSGPIVRYGKAYTINYMSQSKLVTDFNTYENQLILTCLYSMKEKFQSCLRKYEESNLFPWEVVSELIKWIDYAVDSMLSTLDLDAEVLVSPEYIDRYSDDIRYSKTFELINRWFYLNSMAFGNDSRSPILNVTTVFEHYCFVRIVGAFASLGFTEKTSSFSPANDGVDHVCFVKGNEEITIFYEAMVANHENGPPLRMSRSGSRYLLPDFVIRYQSDAKERIGIIDAKFSDKENVSKSWGPDIYYKYGSFIHKSDMSPIDYVYAAYPNPNSDSVEVQKIRSAKFEGTVKPDFGSFSIPLSRGENFSLARFIENLVLG
jgi:hypothetical protein